MMRIVLALCLATFVVADDCCSAVDQAKLKASWNSLWNSGDSSTSKLIFGREVFRRFVDQNQDAIPLFERVKYSDFEGPDFSTHVIRVLTGLDLTINLLGEKKGLAAELKHLNSQHLARTGVTSAHFDSMLDILIETLGVVLDDYDGISFKNCLSSALKVISSNLP